MVVEVLETLDFSRLQGKFWLGKVRASRPEREGAGVARSLSGRPEENATGVFMVDRTS